MVAVAAASGRSQNSTYSEQQQPQPKLVMRNSIVRLSLFMATLVVSFSTQAQTLSGLQLWLTPEGLTNTAALSPVSYWTNSLGTGNDATNGIPANQPVFVPGTLNGYPVVRFLDDGSTATANPKLDWLVSPLPVSGNGKSFTAIIVAASQLSGLRDTLIQQLGSGSTILYHEQTSATNPAPVIRSFASTRDLASPYPYESRSWKIYAVVQDMAAGTLSIYENGFVIASTNVGTAATLANQGWLLGCSKNKNTHGLNGHIAEVMIYDTALNPSDLTTSTYYLAKKFGFVLLTDNFNTGDTSNLDQDISLRQSGALAPQPYDWSMASIAGNQLSLSIGGGAFTAQSFCPDTNLFKLTGKDFQVGYDIVNFNNTGDVWGGAWAGIAINHSQFKPASPVTPDGLAAIISTNGARVFFLNGTPLGQYGGNPGGPPGDAAYETHSVRPPYHVEVTVSDNTAVFKVTGTNSFGTTNLVDVIPLTCPVGNYVSLSIGGAAAASLTYDNLSITASPKAPEILTPLASMPVLLLGDTFNTLDTTNLVDSLPARQSGSAATVSWMTQHFNAESSIQANQLILSNTPPAGAPSVAMVAPTLDFRKLEHLSSFRLRCSMKSFGGINEWVGIRFRDTWPGVFVAEASTPGIGLIIRGNGDWGMFQSGTLISSGNAGIAPSYALEVEVRENVMRASLNGELLNVGCGQTSYLLPNTQINNYVTLQAYANQNVVGHYAAFDDFEVSSLDTGRSINIPVMVNPVYTMVGTNRAFKFDFASVGNVFYGVERKADLTAASWTDALRLYGDGTVITVTNLVGEAESGYYRVKVP